MGEGGGRAGKHPQARRTLSPFTRTSPGEPTGSDVIAADPCVGGAQPWVSRRSPHCLRSFVPPQRRLGKRMRSILFWSYCVFVREILRVTPPNLDKSLFLSSAPMGDPSCSPRKKNTRTSRKSLWKFKKKIKQFLNFMISNPNADAVIESKRIEFLLTIALIRLSVRVVWMCMFISPVSFKKSCKLFNFR